MRIIDLARATQEGESHTEQRIATGDEMQTVHVNGVDLRVLVQGEGSPLVFVHGFPLDHSMWRWQLGQFTRTHRVIAPDLRGFGESDVTEGRVTMEQFADDLAAMLDELHVTEPIVLCGLSMGGYIAFEFVRKHPWRLAGLILCDTRAGADSAEARQQRLATADRVLSEGPSVIADSMVSRLFGQKTRREQPQVVEQTQRLILGTPRMGIAAAALGMADRRDMTGFLPEISVRTLAIAGEEDELTPAAEMKQMAEAIPGAEFVTIPAAGHMAPLEASGAVNAAIQKFLKVPAG
jgi:pimeloyl-ACP methyl ester carboxylesterase